MTIHILDGFAVVREVTQNSDFVSEIRSNVTLTAGVPDTTTTFSYTITNSPPPNDPGLSEVDVTANEILLTLNNISIDEIVNGGDAVNTFIGEVGWDDNGTNKVTQILLLEIDHGDGEATELFFRLGGDALPAVNTVADWDNFDNTMITSIGEIPNSSPLAEGKNILFSSLPDRESFADNPINGTDSGDTITGTAGNDVITPGSTVGFEDRLYASLADDFYVFSDSQAGDFYVLFYNDGSFSSVELTLDGDWAEFYVDKYNGATLLGTDQLIDFQRAVNFDTGDGAYLYGTTGDDVFNVSLNENSWFGLKPLAGNDTFNLGGSGIVRIDYQGNLSGITANLVTSVVQDGYGGTDQINVANGSNVRIEILGTDHSDDITGSDRDERFILREGNDTLDAGGGWDVLRYDRSNVGPVNVDLATGIATGTWGGNAFTHSIRNIEEVRGSRNDNDVLTGNSSDNYLDGRGGNDTLFGGDGEDTLLGGDGNDLLRYDRSGVSAVDVNLANGLATGTWNGNVFTHTISTIEAVWGSRDGNDKIFGDLNDNHLNGNGGADTLNGGDGNDTVLGGDGADVLRGNDGSDFVEGGDGADFANGGKQHDEINGDGGNDHLEGANGMDTIRGGDGDDLIFGGKSNDVIAGGNDNDTIRGNEGKDALFGDQGADSLIGGNQNDTLRGAIGDDTLLGQNGFDQLSGDDGNDLLDGGNAGDIIDGGAGNDTLLGGFGKDSLVGGANSDTLNGGDNNDTLTGGAGNDTFVFTDGWDHDVLTDFSSHDAEDIDLSGVGSITDFTDLVANHIRDNGGSAEIYHGSGNSILLQGVTVAQIGVGQDYSESDFVF